MVTVDFPRKQYTNIKPVREVLDVLVTAKELGRHLCMKATNYS